MPAGVNPPYSAAKLSAVVCNATLRVARAGAASSAPTQMATAGGVNPPLQCGQLSAVVCNATLRVARAQQAAPLRKWRRLQHDGEGDIWRRFIILSSERRRHGAARRRARMPRALETSLAGVGVFPYNPMDLCIPKFCNERDLQ